MSKNFKNRSQRVVYDFEKLHRRLNGIYSRSGVKVIRRIFLEYCHAQNNYAYWSVSASTMGHTTIYTSQDNPSDTPFDLLNKCIQCQKEWEAKNGI